MPYIFILTNFLKLRLKKKQLAGYFYEIDHTLFKELSEDEWVTLPQRSFAVWEI